LGVAAAVGARAEEAGRTATAPGEAVGRVELVEGFPAAGCRVLLEGTPLSTQCDEDGSFLLARVPPGRWTARFVFDALPGVSARRAVVNSSGGRTSDLGVVRLAAPGSVHGRVIAVDADAVASAVVSAPEQGLVAQPNAAGYFLLRGVAPGLRRIQARLPSGRTVTAQVEVGALRTRFGADLDLTTPLAQRAPPEPPPAPIPGRNSRRDLPPVR
jgi:hypothetical protein